MNAAQLAAALGRPHREGREWRCLCPAHEDHDPTLSIRDDDGKVLVNCRAGCAQDAVIAAIKARGLWENPKHERDTSRLNIVAEYDYVTADGDKSYQVVRVEPGKNGRAKDFLQRHKNGAGWVWNLQGIDRVPYHLDELARIRSAASNGTPWRVYIPEGEKCVDRMRSAWQATATTNPGGAGKWRAEYNQHFTGADAVILVDNDKPGRDHAHNVAAQLRSFAAEVTVVEIPGLGPKQDVFDWIGQGHTLDELEQIVKAAKSAPAATQHTGKLIYAKGGALYPCFANAVTILETDPAWQNLFSFDAFANRVELHGTPPWIPQRIDGTWNELQNNLATVYLQRHHDLLVARDIASAAVWTVAHQHSFHPVRQYLDTCRWDGTPRLDGWATTYLGVTPTWRGDEPGYVETVAARWMLAAVARVMQPGCKADCALILEGPQDRHKSTALRTLADPWFTDDFSQFGTKDAAIETAGVWIIELAELDSLTRADSAKIKSFMSRQIDRFRAPYAQLPIEQPRQCVFAGTTNTSEYLKDETGGRRFWPLVCGTIDIDALAADRDQLWAEARDRFLAGEHWYLGTQDQPQVIAQARAEQQARYQPDAWDETIAAFVAPAFDVSVPEILNHLGIPKADWGQIEQNRIARSLRSLGWSRRQRRAGDTREWRYFRPEE